MSKIIKRRARRVGERKKPLTNYRRMYDRRIPRFDFMKYWRAIRYWACRKYEVTPGELDLLFFLYSEMYFDEAKFEEFNNLLPWNRNRLREMIERGWIHIWRQKAHHQRAMYELTQKGRTAITTVYKKLNRQEISEQRTTNPMWYTNVSYADKVYRNFIKKMNISLRQEQYYARQQQKESDRSQ